jgi:hypothetical protein
VLELGKAGSAGVGKGGLPVLRDGAVVGTAAVAGGAVAGTS